MKTFNHITLILSLYLILISRIQSEENSNISEIETIHSITQESSSAIEFLSESSSKSLISESSNSISIESIKSSKSNEDDDEIFEIPTEKSDVKIREDDEDLEIPTEKSDVKYDEKSSKSQSVSSSGQLSKTQNYNEYETEDYIAKYAFILILIFLTIFMGFFIYNLMKCYYKAPRERDQRTFSSDNQAYSRELGNINDDTVLDLSH